MTERRVCPCRATVESEPDEQSQAHAERVHFATPEHQEYVELVEVEEFVGELHSTAAYILEQLRQNEARLTVVGRC